MSKMHNPEKVGKGRGGCIFFLKISFPQKLEMFAVCTGGKIEFVFFTESGEISDLKGQ